jgi:hypothetical protein
LSCLLLRELSGRVLFPFPDLTTEFLLVEVEHKVHRTVETVHEVPILCDVLMLGCKAGFGGDTGRVTADQVCLTIA